jgi:hypothetical protein
LAKYECTVRHLENALGRNLIQVYRRGLGAPANALQQGQNFFKLLLTDVAGVSLSHHGIFGLKG